MNPEYGSLGKQFRSPEDEIAFLKAQIVEQERALGVAPGSSERTPEVREKIAREKVAEYRAIPTDLWPAMLSGTWGK